MNKRIAAILSVLTFAVPGATATDRLTRALNLVEPEVTTESPEEVLEEKYITCSNCSREEEVVLRALQDRGIKDKYALAVIMGNIRQESKFDSKVCEGGRRTGYHGCHRGGFGLIQFTSAHRYRGLGRYARENQMNPDHIETQIQYVFTESEWRAAERGFMQEGKSVGFYMNHAYTWLGWGIHGSRTHYSNQYLRRLV
jgi:hypothetical protein